MPSTTPTSLDNINKADPVIRVSRDEYLERLRQIDRYDAYEVEDIGTADPIEGVQVRSFVDGLMVAEYREPANPQYDTSYYIRTPVAD